MTENGQQCICDVCGKEIFRKCIGEGVSDGGYTRWNEFEAFPDGQDSHFGVGLLCPNCNEEYSAMIENFKNKFKVRNR